MSHFDIKSRFVILLTSLLSLISVYAADSRETLRQLKAQLPEAKSSSDSLAVMVNIYDLSPLDVKTDYGIEVFKYAAKNGFDRMAADIVCNLAYVNYTNDSILTILKDCATKIPDSKYRRIADTYVWLRKAGYFARYSPLKERLERIENVIDEGHFRNVTDPYTTISELGSLCILLGSSKVHRNIIVDYIDQLVELVDTRPDCDFYPRNLIYNYAILIYTHLDKPDKAVATAIKRLKRLDDYLEKSEESGRPYYNLDFMYYITYIGLLKNYEVLDHEQIETYYAKAKAYEESTDDPLINEQFKEAKAYYLMANKKYKEAIPLLWEITTRSKGFYVNHRALMLTIKAAKLADDKDMLYKATEAYTELLERQLETDAQEAYTKMQVLYDIDELQSRNNQLVEKQAEQKSQAKRFKLIATIIAAILLPIFAFIIFRQYLRTKKIAKNLAESNEALRNESEILRKAQLNLIVARDKATKAERLKSEFIDNMSHEITTPLEAIVEYSQLIVDCVDADKKKYLQRYGEIVTLNASMLQNIVNDIFEIGDLEDRELSIKKAPVSAHELCRFAIESLAVRLHPEVEVMFGSQDTPDIIIVTDSKRVEQVLINMLSNGEKFTEQGKVVLSYAINRNDNTISFIVTDDGPGIPEGKEEEIFQRFAKLDKHTQGIGLGLPICRMIADLLKGTIVVDTSYTTGARFVFTIPIL